MRQDSLEERDDLGILKWCQQKIYVPLTAENYRYVTSKNKLLARCA